jgi:hypothetical protein
MIEKAGRSGKIKQGPALAMTAIAYRNRAATFEYFTELLASCEKSRVRAAGADFQVHPLRTLGAIALVCSLIAIDVNSRVHIATRELDANEVSSGRRIAGTIVLERIIDKI